MSESNSTLYKELAASVGPMATLPNNGASYHTGEQIITHLNRVLGPANWSFRVIEIGEEADSDECWAFGEITATISGTTVVKQDYGSQAFKKSRATGKYVSKWDDKKSAATDALKRCARLLGVGLDAWAKESAPSWHPDLDDAAMAEQKRTANKPAPSKPAPTKPTPIRQEQPSEPLPERAGLIRAYREAAQKAIDAGHHQAADLIANKPEDMPDAKLVAIGDSLTKWLNKQKVAG